MNRSRYVTSQVGKGGLLPLSSSGIQAERGQARGPQRGSPAGVEATLANLIFGLSEFCELEVGLTQMQSNQDNRVA
jgi:hypothetical protein